MSSYPHIDFPRITRKAIKQRVYVCRSQNDSIKHNASRLVTRTPLREHITPVVKQQHWLPVECRITYKLMVLVYKCVNDTAPAYLSRLIQPKCRDSRLRPPSDLELHHPVPNKAIGALVSDLWDRPGGTNFLNDCEDRHHYTFLNVI